MFRRRQSSPPRRRWAAAALLTCCLGLTACQGFPGEPANPSPSPSMPGSPSPSPSPSASPSPSMSPSPSASPSPSKSPSASPSPSKSPSPSASPSTPVTVTVEVVHHPDLIGAFDPATVTVPVGGTVAWQFLDRGASGNAAVPHNVSGPGFRSENMSEGTFTHTFTEAGQVHYVCTIHPGMEGDVNVVAP
jgi:plastocyanin